MKHYIKFPFVGGRGRNESNLRNSLVTLLNNAQNDYVFSTFTTNATNFHSDGCIFVVKNGDKAHNRYSKTVIEYWNYGGSLPSCYPNGITDFDSAYISARQFIRDNCNI